MGKDIKYHIHIIFNCVKCNIKISVTPYDPLDRISCFLPLKWNWEYLGGTSVPVCFICWKKEKNKLYSKDHHTPVEVQNAR